MTCRTGRRQIYMAYLLRTSVSAVTRIYCIRFTVTSPSCVYTSKRSVKSRTRPRACKHASPVGGISPPLLRPPDQASANRACQEHAGHRLAEVRGRPLADRDPPWRPLSARDGEAPFRVEGWHEPAGVVGVHRRRVDEHAAALGEVAHEQLLRRPRMRPQLSGHLLACRTHCVCACALARAEACACACTSCLCESPVRVHLYRHAIWVGTLGHGACAWGHVHGACAWAWACRLGGHLLPVHAKHVDPPVEPSLLWHGACACAWGTGHVHGAWGMGHGHGHGARGMSSRPYWGTGMHAARRGSGMCGRLGARRCATAAWRARVAAGTTWTQARVATRGAVRVARAGAIPRSPCRSVAAVSRLRPGHVRHRMTHLYHVDKRHEAA